MWEPWRLGDWGLGGGWGGDWGAGAGDWGWGAFGGGKGKGKPTAPKVSKPVATAPTMPGLVSQLVRNPEGKGLGGAPPFKKAKAGEAGPDDCVGEIRFETPMEAQQALQLDGSELAGHTLRVQLDEKSKDGTKLIVYGVSENLKWEVLKDYFKQAGRCVFANVKTGCSLPCTGQVRFETPQAAAAALQLSGTDLGGYSIEVKAHPGSKDGTKLQIFNLPPGCEWQQLKDFFAQSGLSPLFVDTSNNKSAAVGEVRFEDPKDAQSAANVLNGSSLGGGVLQVEIDQNSREGDKLRVSGIPPGIEWQELKDHFGQIGQVAFVKIDDGKGKGKGMEKGMGMMKGMMKGMGCMGKGMMGDGLMITPSGLVVPVGMGDGGGFGCGFGKGAFGKGGFGKGCGFGMGCWGGGKGSWGGGCKGGGGMGGDGTEGEVRFDFPLHAQAALQGLDGSTLGGATIHVSANPSSHDGTKLVVTGLAPGTKWQELKDHFAQAGQVAFVNVK